MIDDIGQGRRADNPVGIWIRTSVHRIVVAFIETVVYQVNESTQSVANQRQKDDVFEDLVDQKGIKTVQTISFYVFVEFKHFDHFDENDVVVYCGIIVPVIEDDLSD